MNYGEFFVEIIHQIVIIFLENIYLNVHLCAHHERNTIKRIEKFLVNYCCGYLYTLIDKFPLPRFRRREERFNNSKPCLLNEVPFSGPRSTKGQGSCCESSCFNKVSTANATFLCFGYLFSHLYSPISLAVMFTKRLFSGTTGAGIIGITYQDLLGRSSCLDLFD